MKNKDDESKLENKSDSLQEQITSEEHPDLEKHLQILEEHHNITTSESISITSENNENSISKEQEESQQLSSMDLENKREFSTESEDIIDEEDIQSENESSDNQSSLPQFRVLPNDAPENEHHNIKLQKYFQTGNEFIELSQGTTLKLGVLTVLYNLLQNKETQSSNAQINTMLQNILMNFAMSFVKKSDQVPLFVLSKIDDANSKQSLDQLQQNLIDEIIRIMQLVRQDDAINNINEQYQKTIYNLLDAIQKEIIKFIHNEHLLKEPNEQKITLNAEMFKTTKNFVDTFQAIMQHNNNDDYYEDDDENYDDEDDDENDDDYIEDFLDYEVGYNIFDEDLNITTISKQTLNRIQLLNGIYTQCLHVYPKKLQDNIDYFDNTKEDYKLNSKLFLNKEISAKKNLTSKDIPDKPYNNIMIIMEKWNFIHFQKICKKLHFSCKKRCFPILTIDENKISKLSFAELNGICVKHYHFFRKYDNALKKFSKNFIQYKLWCKNFIYTQYKILLEIIDNIIKR